MSAVVIIGQTRDGYPASLCDHLRDDAPDGIATIGDLGIAHNHPMALFCSVKCPGSVILQTYDMARALRDAGRVVIGGFQSPMERECLDLLLRGKQPVILCPARSIETMRVRSEWKAALDEGRLLIVSPFIKKPRRPTVETATFRNRFVAALADRILFAYAEPNGKTEQLCREVVQWGKTVYAIESEANAHLIRLGAKPVKPEDVNK
ncbi:MAG: DNA-processing protein DprA [Planctomycetota bacterium]